MSVSSPPAERAIPFEHMMYDHLQKWGPRKQEVKFFLRHEDSPTESSDQGARFESRFKVFSVSDLCLCSPENVPATQARTR